LIIIVAAFLFKIIYVILLGPPYIKIIFVTSINYLYTTLADLTYPVLSIEAWVLLLFLALGVEYYFRREDAKKRLVTAIS